VRDRSLWELTGSEELPDSRATFEEAAFEQAATD